MSSSSLGCTSDVHLQEAASTMSSKKTARKKRRKERMKLAVNKVATAIADDQGKMRTAPSAVDVRPERPSRRKRKKPQFTTKYSKKDIESPFDPVFPVGSSLWTSTVDMGRIEQQYPQQQLQPAHRATTAGDLMSKSKYSISKIGGHNGCYISAGIISGYPVITLFPIKLQDGDVIGVRLFYLDERTKCPAITDHYMTGIVASSIDDTAVAVDGEDSAFTWRRSLDLHISDEGGDVNFTAPQCSDAGAGNGNHLSLADLTGAHTMPELVTATLSRGSSSIVWSDVAELRLFRSTRYQVLIDNSSSSSGSSATDAPLPATRAAGEHMRQEHVWKSAENAASVEVRLAPLNTTNDLPQCTSEDSNPLVRVESPHTFQDRKRRLLEQFL